MENPSQGRSALPACSEDAMTENRTTGIEIKSLTKALRLLKLFSPQRKEWAFEEMVTASGYHKSSVQRILATLERQGFVARTVPRRSRYRLGPELLYLGNVAEMSIDLAAAARPIMEALVRKVRETCYLCVAEDFRCLYIEKVECSQPVQIIHPVGKRNPMHCTGVGKALMSGMSEETIERLIASHGLDAYTRRTITDPLRLKRELESVRRRGIAVDNEELDPGVRCVAAPVRDASGKVVAALSISGPAQRFTPAALRRFEKEVRQASIDISQRLGFAPAECRGPARRRRGNGSTAKIARQ
jgi:DNA-binding IclR family transcriptional regulator